LPAEGGVLVFLNEVVVEVVHHLQQLVEYILEGVLRFDQEKAALQSLQDREIDV